MNKTLKIGLFINDDPRWVGGTEYIKNIILALGSLPTEVRSTFELCLICDGKLQDSLLNQISPYLHTIYLLEDHLPPITLLNRIRWKVTSKLFNQENPRWSDFFSQEKFDFIYPYLGNYNSRLPLRSAAWIPDFQHKHLPHFFSESHLQETDQYFAKIAQQAPLVVLSSKTAESDFHELFPKATQKTVTLPFKSFPKSTWYEQDPLKTQLHYNLPDRFFIISNQFWQHKNHLTVLKALKLLQENSIYPIIVCTGHIYDFRKPDYSDTILQTIHTLGISNQVYLMGLIPKTDQIQLIRRSLAVIQPSLFEGWSTIVEDARCFGKKIAISDLSVHFEQNPPNSIFFDRNSPENLADILADWWKNLQPGPDLEQEAIAKKVNFDEVQAFGYRFLEIAAGNKLNYASCQIQN
ncbi:glycosyltransferase [Fortiea contorta]|uniref:glycosyltransferase n=1 Tax=Fortiea contorta TaxID=1892405 RepID=UPI0003467965|nr:glycosyltransferase [Fortiea contorta]